MFGLELHPDETFVGTPLKKAAYLRAIASCGSMPCASYPLNFIMPHWGSEHALIKITGNKIHITMA
jgi:hypothetical protein